MSTKETIKQGIRELVQSVGSTTQYSKEFFEFVKQIGDARTKADEDRIIQVEMRTLKTKMASKDTHQIQKYMKEYLIRMLYCEMLGHEASFGHINAVNMVSSRNLLEKRIGYLSVCLTLHKDHQLMILLVNAFQTDLKSENFLEICMALHAVTKLVSVDFIPALLPHVLALLSHKQAIVRKKAVVCLQRFYQLQNSSIHNLNDLVLKALCDPDPSVMAAALLVLKEVVPQNITEYKMIIPSLVTILKQIIEHRLPREYDYHRLPAPWIQMNILSLISTLCHGDRKSSELVFDLLSDVLKRAAISSNIGYSIVYQCIRTITNIYPNTALLKSAADAVSFFLQSPYHNLKYLGVTSLAMIIKVEPSFAADHQLIVIDCLQSHDETLQRKTFDLLYHMTNPTNVIAIVDTMIKHLKITSNTIYRSELCCKILDLCDLYAPNGTWYVLTVSTLYEIGGNDIPLHKTYNVINFLISLIDEQDEENVQIRKGLTNECIAKLQSLEMTLGNSKNGEDKTISLNGIPKSQSNENVVIPDCYMKTIAWVLGEFGMKPSGYDGFDLIDLLSSRLLQTYADPSVKHWVLRAIVRIIAQLPQDIPLSPTIQTIINNARQSQDVILQQIANELYVLVYGTGSGSTSRAFLNHISGTSVQPSLSLQTDLNLSFLQPLVQSALKAGACTEYIPNYLESHANEKQLKSTLRFEAYEKAQPVVRVVAPTAAAAPKPVAGPESNHQPTLVQPEGKITLKLGGSKGTWGPKGFNNPNSLKSSTEEQNVHQNISVQPIVGASYMDPANTATLQQPSFSIHKSSTISSLSANQQPMGSNNSSGDLFGGLKPKPRASEQQALQLKQEKNQQTAKGLFAGFGGTQPVQKLPTATTAPTAAPAGAKFAFKGNINIKKTGASTSAPISVTAPIVTPATQAHAQKADSSLDLLFGSSSSPPASKPSSANGQLGDLFFGMGGGASTAISAPKETTPQNSGAFDLFSSLSPTSQSNTAAPTVSSGFDFDMFGLGNTPPATTTAVASPSQLQVFWASNTAALQQVVGVGLQNAPQQQIAFDNSSTDFILQQQLYNKSVVIWVNNAKPMTSRYASQPIKVQYTLPINQGGNFVLDMDKTVLIDHTTQQKYSPTLINNGTVMLFSFTTSNSGLGSLSLVITPKAVSSIPILAQNSTAFNTGFHLTIGSTTYTASTNAKQQLLPVLSCLQSLEIATGQYGQLWKTFGTVGEYKMNLNATKLTSNEAVAAFLQKVGSIHLVQTIKQETIASACFIGEHGVSDVVDSAVLLHIKLLGDGHVSIHCRSKTNAYLGQMFLHDVARAIQQL